MPAATQAPDVGPRQTHRISTLPTELLLVAESQWLFTESELCLAPSISEGGLSPEKERENRSKGVNFILQAGIMLKLPQITLATASVFLHRFYMRHSMVDVHGRPGYHYYSMAATCLFLATKVEENCRKMKELVVACVRVAQKDPAKLVDEQDKEYWKWRDNILLSEDVLLEALCFDLSLEAPYKTLFELLLQLRYESHKRLRNAAWAFVNDSCLTLLCLLFSSRTIAASALYMAAKHAGVSFPDDEAGRPWWGYIGVDVIEVRRACNYMAETYENVPPKAGRDRVIYERTPENLNDGDDITRDMEPRSVDRQSRDGRFEREEQKSLKRGRHVGSESDERGLANGISSNVVSTKASGGREESPQKKVKLGGDIRHHPAQADQPQSMIGQPNHLLINNRSTDEKTENQAALFSVRMEQAGPISPKPDDVSEEGEVEP